MFSIGASELSSWLSCLRKYVVSRRFGCLHDLEITSGRSYSKFNYWLSARWSWSADFGRKCNHEVGSINAYSILKLVLLYRILFRRHECEGGLVGFMLFSSLVRPSIAQRSGHLIFPYCAEQSARRWSVPTSTAEMDS